MTQVRLLHDFNDGGSIVGSKDDVLEIPSRSTVGFLVSMGYGEVADPGPNVSGLLAHEEREVAASKPEAPTTEVSNADETEKPKLERPKPYASKPEWVAYAIAWGADEDKANAMGKAELVKLYGDSA